MIVRNLSTASAVSAIAQAHDISYAVAMTWANEMLIDQIKAVRQALRTSNKAEVKELLQQLRILICVNGVLKHVNTPDSYLRERCANIVDSVRSLA